MDFLHSVEFYVILLLAAALVIGLMALPASHGPVETTFANGRLDLSDDPDTTPRLEIECRPDGTVTLIRHGLPDGLDTAATVALAITRKGFDLQIEERITPASRAMLSSETMPADRATFTLGPLAPDRYHIRYNSEPTSTFTTFTLMNRPGLRTTRPLRQA